MPAREIPLRRHTIKKPDTFTNVVEGGRGKENGYWSRKWRCGCGTSRPIFNFRRLTYVPVTQTSPDSSTVPYYLSYSKYYRLFSTPMPDTAMSEIPGQYSVTAISKSFYPFLVASYCPLYQSISTATARAVL
jgi:hypothetical protein